MPTARTATVSVPTYAWTKLYTEVISSIIVVCKCRLICMDLTRRNLNHRCDEIVLPVGSLPLMISSSKE